MGQDLRIRDLNAVGATELKTLLSTVALALDDPSFSANDAKKVLLSVLLTSDIVAEDTDITHRALTPKGFNSSVATTSRRGVVRLAKDTEVVEKSNSVALAPVDFPLALSTETHFSYHISTPESVWNVIAGYNPGSVSVWGIYVGTIGKLAYMKGGIIVNFSGVVKSFSIIFQGFSLAKVEQAVSATVVNNESPIPCGARVYNSGQNLILNIYSSVAFPSSCKILIDATYLKA